jgi:predicted dehydrogenase
VNRDKLAIGMVGAGFIGQLAHLANLVEDPLCRVVALAEMRNGLRESVARRYDIPKTYATHAELIADGEVDAVVVVTPRDRLGPVVFDCLSAGKHVLSEKPMAGSVEQASRLVAVANERGCTYTVGYMKRYDAGVECAKAMLDDARARGSLGELLGIHARCYMGNSYCAAYGHIVTDERTEYLDDGWSIGPEWLPEGHRPKFGSFLNTYSHVTNLLRYLMGRSPSVHYANLTGRAAQLCVLDFGECLATLATGRMSHRGWDEEVHFTFSDGELVIKLPPALLRNVPASVEIYIAGATQAITRPLPEWSWSFRRQAEAFVLDVLERKDPRSPGADSIEDLWLCEALWKSDMERIGHL